MTCINRATRLGAIGYGFCRTALTALGAPPKMKKESMKVSAITRSIAALLVVVLGIGSAPLLAQQALGTIAGKADDEARKPYADYAVQLRDVVSGQVANTRPLGLEGQFSFTGVGLSRKYLVELVQINEKKIVCTEGPFELTASVTNKLDVNISCGKVPAAIWLLAAGAGAAAAVAVTTRSTSR